MTYKRNNETNNDEQKGKIEDNVVDIFQPEKKEKIVKQHIRTLAYGSLIESMLKIRAQWFQRTSFVLTNFLQKLF